MSNAIIKQQGDSSFVADNIWEFRLGAGSFILGALAGTLVTAAVGMLATQESRQAADAERLADQLRAPWRGKSRTREHHRGLP